MRKLLTLGFSLIAASCGGGSKDGRETPAQPPTQANCAAQDMILSLDGLTCVAGPIKLTCKEPQVPNAEGTQCVDPAPIPKPCDKTGIAGGYGKLCVDPNPGPVVCTPPQVPGGDGKLCVDPNPTPVVCTAPLVLSADGKTCVTASGLEEFIQPLDERALTLDSMVFLYDRLSFRELFVTSSAPIRVLDHTLFPDLRTISPLADQLVPQSKPDSSAYLVSYSPDTFTATGDARQLKMFFTLDHSFSPTLLETMKQHFPHAQFMHSPLKPITSRLKMAYGIPGVELSIFNGSLDSAFLNRNFEQVTLKLDTTALRNVVCVTEALDYLRAQAPREASEFNISDDDIVPIKATLTQEYQVYSRANAASPWIKDSLKFTHVSQMSLKNPALSGSLASTLKSMAPRAYRESCKLNSGSDLRNQVQHPSWQKLVDIAERLQINLVNMNSTP